MAGRNYCQRENQNIRKICTDWVPDFHDRNAGRRAFVLESGMAEAQQYVSAAACGDVFPV